MRLWDYRLIKVLPNAQLKAMRYEIGDMIKQYPNIKNSLVKYANNYDIAYLYYYFNEVLKEFDKRGINHKASYDLEIKQSVFKESNSPILPLKLVYPEHNDRYLKQCYYNLQEKYDRGIINEEEWQKISENTHISMI